MVKQTTRDKESSSIIWNNLEEMVVGFVLMRRYLMR